MLRERILASVQDKAARGQHPAAERDIERLGREIEGASAILIGAGAGLSAAAGSEYAGEEFQRNFGDFIEKYGFPDMYVGGFGPFDSPEEYWAWWSRQVYLQRYNWPADETHKNLLRLVDGKNYFVLTTNVDHRFQIAGFDKERLFYTQGDFGLFQCTLPCHQETYDNEEPIRRMYEEQEGMRVPTELLPTCPHCGRPMTENLRIDGTFVQDEGWYAAAERYRRFLDENAAGNILFLELGVGANTPGIIKYPMWQMTADNPDAVYASINQGDAVAPREIQEQSILINDDIARVLKELVQQEAGA